MQLKDLRLSGDCPFVQRHKAAEAELFSSVPAINLANLKPRSPGSPCVHPNNYSARRRHCLLLTLMVLCAAWWPVLAEGIPEPSLIQYGIIQNTAENNSRLTFGILEWQFYDAARSRAVTVTTSVTNVLDQFSFVLRVPCETYYAGAEISPTALFLTPARTAFDRSRVTLIVGDKSYPVTFATPSQVSTTLGSMDRGRIERLDLTVYIPIVDVDGNGLPDDWETVYCGCVGCCDPQADPDGDGLTTWEEYRSGTDPNNAQSVFRFIRYDVHPDGGFQVEWSSTAGRA